MRIGTLIPALLFASFFLVPASNAGNLPPNKGVQLSIRMYLQGAMLGVKQPSMLMRDDLRTTGQIPLQEPYSARENYSHYGVLGGTEVIENQAVLNVEGSNAIVDWVFVELRHPELQKVVLATRSALLQRDGDVVDVDGVSPLQFPDVEPGTYMVAVRHRNHLGVMATLAFNLTETPQIVDFTNPKLKCYGNKPMIQLRENIMALFAGDANHNGRVEAEGAESDKEHIFFHVLLSPDNVDANQNFVLKGYDDSDINMDGLVKYQGPSSDGAQLTFDIVFLWQHNCPEVGGDCRLVEELP
ncbi:MAG: hypothetical protein IT258_21255 [Saprospiraceae bacterium]|nr:hypothetical protein [Saprospiraceae bacterium]